MTSSAVMLYGNLATGKLLEGSIRMNSPKLSIESRRQCDCELLSPYAWPHDARASAAFSETMVRRHAQHWGSFPYFPLCSGNDVGGGAGEVR